MKIGKHQIVWRDKEPFLDVEIDGRTARIFTEQKGWHDGIIFLGIDFVDEYSAVLPADLAEGRPADRKMEGFTDNAEILRLYTEFRKRLDSVRD